MLIGNVTAICNIIVYYIYIIDLKLVGNTILSLEISHSLVLLRISVQNVECSFLIDY